MGERVEPATNQRFGDVATRSRRYLIPPLFQFAVDLSGNLPWCRRAAVPTPIALFAAG